MYVDGRVDMVDIEAVTVVDVVVVPVDEVCTSGT